MKNQLTVAAIVVGMLITLVTHAGIEEEVKRLKADRDILLYQLKTLDNRIFNLEKIITPEQLPGNKAVVNAAMNYWQQREDGTTGHCPD